MILLTRNQILSLLLAGGKRVKGPQAAHLDQAQASTTAANIFTQLVTSQHNSSHNSINSIQVILLNILHNQLSIVV
jgi:hypothetical protein